MATIRWEKPELRLDEEENKKRSATWLELFYDLVFVAAIVELSHLLATHLSLEGFFGFVLLFIPVLFVWIGTTIYNDRFEKDDISHRLFIFLQMIFIAGFAVFIHDALGALSTFFALTYVGARSILIFLWWRAGIHNKQFRPISNRYIIGFSLSIFLWIISIFLPAPEKFYLWGLALLIDFSITLTTIEMQKNLPKLSSSHLPERFGLFIIIVLGESIIGVASGLGEINQLTFSNILPGVLGLLLAFGIWWLYFDHIGNHKTKFGSWWSIAWMTLHIPLIIGITAIGAGILNIIISGILPNEIRLLMTGSVGLTLIIIGLIELCVEENKQAHDHTDHSKKISHFVGGIAAILIGLFGIGLNSVETLGLLLIIIILQIAYGIFSHQHLKTKHEH